MTDLYLVLYLYWSTWYKVLQFLHQAVIQSVQLFWHMTSVWPTNDQPTNSISYSVRRSICAYA